MQIDLGDVVLGVNLTVKGLRPPHLRWHIGPTTDTTPASRPPAGPRPPYKTQPRKVDLYMDLKADQQVSFNLQATDEVGNPATFDGTISFQVDDTSIVNLVDNGDGTGTVTATGALGTATLTGTATRSDGRTATGVAAIQVVAGDAETFAIEFGEPTEATPDEV